MLQEKSTAYGKYFEVAFLMDTKLILWQNVQALMIHKYGEVNLWKMCNECNIGPGTGSRIKEGKTSVGLDVIEKIASYFELLPWQLLVPKLDPSNPPFLIITEIEKRLYASMKAVANEMIKNNPQ